MADHEPVIGSLCSGYGGLDLGVQAVLGGRVAWHVEYDKDPSAILHHHWPHVPNHGDVKTTDWMSVEPVDILTAGYPCQPFSHAGKRKGSDDPRHLWPDVARAIGALRPRLVVLENVRGHVSLGLADVLGDLSHLGYDAAWGLVRASDAGAPHARARIFILATDAAGEGLEVADGITSGPRQEVAVADGATHADTHGERSHGRGQLPGSALLRDGLSVAAERGDDAPDSEGNGRQGGDAGGPAAERPGSAPPVHDFGPYAGAVDRWARILGRPAPAPTDVDGKTQRPRLSPAFVEWMMGLDPGHVTDTPGLSRNAQLKALGNGVVPPQAALALRALLPILTSEGP